MDDGKSNLGDISNQGSTEPSNLNSPIHIDVESPVHDTSTDFIVEPIKPEPIEPIEPKVEPMVESTNIRADQPLSMHPTMETSVSSGHKKHSFSPKVIFPKGFRNKLGKFASPLAILIVVIFVAGVSYGAKVLIGKNTVSSTPISKLATLPIVPFQITSTLPANNGLNIQNSTSVTLNFNEPVNPSKLESVFNITPNIKGTFVQGANNRQIIFKPLVPFSGGTIVSIMIDNTYQSLLGQKLRSDFLLSFTTQTPSDAVEFGTQNDMYNLDSEQSNTNLAMTLSVGTQVSASGSIDIYKASLAPLLSSLVYSQTTQNGYTSDNATYNSVDTSGMLKLASSVGLKDQASFNINEPAGIYFVAAISNGKQVGWTWVIFNDYGTVLRQDDQKIVLSAFNLSDNSVPSNANVTFYNLLNSVKVLKTSGLQSPQAYTFPYSTRVDLSVVTVGQDTMIVPIAIPSSLEDNRVRTDLSQTRTYYLVTDKPTYRLNDTVKFSGYVNIDNDAQFNPDQETSIKLFVAPKDNPSTHLQDLTVPVDSNGMISGQLSVSSALAAQSDLAIYGYQDFANQNPVSIANFSTSSASSEYSLKVSFSKASYLANDTINATITATQQNGQPLSNVPVTYDVYSKPYYETNSANNLSSYGDVGAQLGQDQTVQLNGQGQATVSVNIASELASSGSQVVTFQAQKTDLNKVVAGAGASTIVHQGNMILNFGIGKDYFNQNDIRTGRLYATDLNGQPLSDTQVSYQYVTYTYNSTTQAEDPTILNSGTVTTDSNGYAQISQQLNTTDDVTIIASAKDSLGNVVTGEYNTYTNSSTIPIMAGADNLDYLDISGSSSRMSVGDQVPLTISSPKNLTVLVSYERGRIYKYQTLQLMQGTNTYNLDVTSQLAPSFNIVFSYFVDGEYHTEGANIAVSNSANKLNIGVSADKATYSAGQTAQITISSKNGSGQGLPTHLIIGVESDSEFNLSNSFIPDMYSYYYSNRDYSTNSSSSLTGIGSGGDGCGGSGGGGTALTNDTGTTLYWNPNLATDSSGNATISVPLTTGSWHVVVYGMSSSGSAVGDSELTLTAQ